MLDNKNALLFIRGESPIIDEKYNTFKHPNFKYTEDGGYKPYIHGKSFTAKQEICSILIKENNADVIIIDPENEFAGLVNAFGGEVIEISSASKNHINAMDMNRYYGDNINPIILKSEFILSLCEQLMGRDLQPPERSVIDRCTAQVYLLFNHEYSANFLFELWKRVRKYGACCTGITQDIDDILKSKTATRMLSNSELIIMLNQSSRNRTELAKLLNISDTQLGYITNVDAGHGLIKIGNALVPFVNKFPKDTELYKLMTTKLFEII